MFRFYRMMLQGGVYEALHAKGFTVEAHLRRASCSALINSVNPLEPMAARNGLLWATRIESASPVLLRPHQDAGGNWYAGGFSVWSGVNSSCLAVSAMLWSHS